MSLDYEKKKNNRFFNRVVGYFKYQLAILVPIASWTRLNNSNNDNNRRSAIKRFAGSIALICIVIIFYLEN